MKKLSTAQQSKQERNADIVSLFGKYKEELPTKLDIYMAISKEVGCCHITVYRVLKSEGLL